MSAPGSDGARILACTQVRGREQIRDAFDRYGLNPPLWLADPLIDMDRVLVLEAAPDHQPAGLVLGVCYPEKDMAMLHMLFMVRNCRTAANLRALILSFAEAARDGAGVKTICWKYETGQEREDARERLLRNQPETRTECRILAVRTHIDLRRMCVENPRLADCGEELLGRQGMRLVPLGKADSALLEQIRTVCADPEGEAAALTPLEDGPYDMENSMIWADADTGALCGWMAVRLAGPDAVDMARCYVVPGVRAGGLGISFYAYMMQRLSGHYASGFATILTRNRPMLFFIRRFFGAVTTEHYMKLLTIRFREQ